MDSTTVQEKIQRFQRQIYSEYPLVKEIVEALDASGGRALVVGGAVRDVLLEVPMKDLDIEVHGVLLEQLQKILEKFGPVRLVGKQFGVLRIDGLDVDFSIPRSDGSGRKPQVKFDPNMSLKEAFRRRDLTMNAMGIDLITLQLEDPFNGQRDIKLKVLRTPDPDLFIEDPLRFYRIMQFISRFQMKPDEELQELCKTMDLKNVSVERIYDEFEKLFLKSKAPSWGIRWLQEVGRLKETLPELYATIGIHQDPVWHPEGDVFEHTMQALDAACEENLSGDAKIVLCFAALCHDLGKVTTTKKIDGRIRSIGHDVEGVVLAEALLKRITNTNSIKETVCKLVRYHMMPGQFVSNNAGPSAYKRLAKKLSPQTSLEFLSKLARADKRGRNPEKQAPLEEQTVVDIQTFLTKAANAHVLTEPEAPVLTGADLLDVVEPGVRMGELLQKAYEIQIEEGIVKKEELKKRILK